MSTAVNEVDRRIQELLDREAIRDLHVTYAFLVDEHRWDEAAALFLPDAVADWGPTRACVAGRDAITAHFTQRVAPVSQLTRHMMTEMRIAVDGDRAKAACYMFGCGTKRTSGGPVPVWTLGRYDNDVCRAADGAWRFAHLRFAFTFQTPFHEGWVQNGAFASDLASRT